MDGQITKIDLDRLEIKQSWGRVSILVFAIATHTIDTGATVHNERYSIQFERDQITGRVNSVEVAPREDSTEHTLTSQVIADECLDFLNDN